MPGIFSRWVLNRFCVVFALALTGACISSSSPPPPSPVFERKTPKISDPEKQRECQKEGKNPCRKDTECEELCRDIFTSRRNERDCLELSREMVLDFDDLLNFASKGRWEQIDSYVLECLLDIDDEEFSKSLKKVGKNKARDFLILITEEPDLASVLEEEDDEFNILKRLVDEAFSSRTLTSVLTEKIEDSKSFLLFAGVGGEEVFKWLDGYVSEECERGVRDCPGQEPIGAYCQALLGFRDRVLEEFVSDSDGFADDYEDEVESAGFEYEREGLEDFCRDWLSKNAGSDGGSSLAGPLTRETYTAFCRLPTSQCGSLTYDDLIDNPPAGDDICLTKYDSIRSLLDPDADCSSFVQPSPGDGGGSPTPPPTPTPDPPSRNARIQTVTGACPTANNQVLSIPDAYQLGRLTAEIVRLGNELYYWKSSFIDSSGGTAKGSNRGGFSPDSDIMRAYTDILGTAHIWLDGDLIPSFDKTKSWFIYGDIPTATATTLSHVEEYSAGGVNYHKFSLGTTVTTGTGGIFLAYEDNGNCKYILPPSTN